MKNKIELFIDGDTWVARHSGPAVSRIVAAFGGCDIPTAFTSDMAAAEVFDKISALNPEYEVCVRLRTEAPVFGEPSNEEFVPRDYNDADGVETMLDHQ